MIDGCPHIKDELEAAGVTVYTYPGKELSWRGTGGPTCLTIPIFRK
jgi:arginine deiminase